MVVLHPLRSGWGGLFNYFYCSIVLAGASGALLGENGHSRLVPAAEERCHSFVMEDDISNRH